MPDQNGSAADQGQQGQQQSQQSQGDQGQQQGQQQQSQQQGQQQQQSQGQQQQGQQQQSQQQAPADYTFKFADGVTVSEKTVGEVKGVAKKLGLSQEHAQELADATVRVQQQLRGDLEATIKAEHAKWADQVKADKELGGEKLNENLAIALKARDAFGTPELKALLDQSGLGNHPEVVRFFFKVGQTLKEDTTVHGNQPGSETDAAKVLYPNMA